MSLHGTSGDYHKLDAPSLAMLDSQSGPPRGCLESRGNVFGELFAAHARPAAPRRHGAVYKPDGRVQVWALVMGDVLAQHTLPRLSKHRRLPAHASPATLPTPSSIRCQLANSEFGRGFGWFR